MKFLWNLFLVGFLFSLVIAAAFVIPVWLWFSGVVIGSIIGILVILFKLDEEDLDDDAVL